MKLQGKVTCRFLSRITNHSNLLTDEAHAKVRKRFLLANRMFFSYLHMSIVQKKTFMQFLRLISLAEYLFQRSDSCAQVSDEKRKMVMGSYIDQKNAMEIAILSGKTVFTGPQAAAFNAMRMNGTARSSQIPAADGVRALPSTFPLHVRLVLPSLLFCCNILCMYVLLL
jgi:hypothetical protein